MSHGRRGGSGINLSHCESHGAVNVVVICVIENIVHFPSQLNSAPLTDMDVLKERQIVVED